MPLINYDLLIKNSLRHVVKQALQLVEKDGLFGAQHFFITFSTECDGVEMPDYLFNEFPEELTIVLENQFWNLKVFDNHFSISLNFNSRMESLEIPFEAVLEFSDPSEDFVLQFDMDEVESIIEGEFNEEDLQKAATESKKKPTTDNVVSLDAFRKK
jgi:uncharacterized protein